jgi:hypothetical protein
LPGALFYFHLIARRDEFSAAGGGEPGLAKSLNGKDRKNESFGQAFSKACGVWGSAPGPETKKKTQEGEHKQSGGLSVRGETLVGGFPVPQSGTKLRILPEAVSTLEALVRTRFAFSPPQAGEKNDPNCALGMGSCIDFGSTLL